MLIKKCNIASKEKRRALLNHEIRNKIKHVGIVTPVKNKIILDKNIKILIRELDAKEQENEQSSIFYQNICNG